MGKYTIEQVGLGRYDIIGPNGCYIESYDNYQVAYNRVQQMIANNEGADPLDIATSGCVAELIRLVFVAPFKILSDIFKFKGSLIIWPLPLILIIACLVTQQYAGMIYITIFAIIITYIAKWISNIVKWQSQSPLEKELNKLNDRARRSRHVQEAYTTLRSATISVTSPGNINKLNSMRSRNLISDEEYVYLRDNLAREQSSQQSR